MESTERPQLTSYITLKEYFPPKFGENAKMFTLPISNQYSTGSPSQCNYMQGREIKAIQIRKEEIKWTLFKIP